MSWFFGGGNNSKDSDSNQDVSNSSFDTPSPYQEHAYDNHAEFVPPAQQYSSPRGGSFQEQILAEQQKMMVQQLLLKLTEQAFDTCVSNPGSSLSSSERSCIAASATKYIQAGEFIMKKVGSSGLG